MPTRTKNQNTYIHGDWNALCDICGFKFKASDLKKNSDGYMVCKEDWEPEHPSDTFKAPTEDQSVPWTRPEGTDAGGTDVSGNVFTADDDGGATLSQGQQPDPDADGLVEGNFLKDGEVESGKVTKA